MVTQPIFDDLHNAIEVGIRAAIMALGAPLSGDADVPGYAPTHRALGATLSRDALLGRKQAAEFLTAQGRRTAERTLATLASRPGKFGPGPRYMRFGRRVVYRVGDLIEWADRRLSNPITTTSEGDIQDIKEHGPAVLQQQSVQP